MIIVSNLILKVLSMYIIFLDSGIFFLKLSKPRSLNMKIFTLSFK